LTPEVACGEARRVRGEAAGVDRDPRVQRDDALLHHVIRDGRHRKEDAAAVAFLITFIVSSADETD
jgi:hypothetical protein